MRNALVAIGVIWSSVAGAQFLANGSDTELMAAMPMMLFSNDSVKNELKLSGKQKSDIKKILDANNKAMSELSRSTGNDMAAGMAAMKKIEESQTKAEADIMALLDDGQKTRFAQIRYQVLGARSLELPEVQAAVGLSEDQKAMVQQYAKSVRSGALDSIRKGPGALKGWNKDRPKREEEHLKMLSAEQAEKYKAIMGPEFKGVKKIQGR
jgi:hypothetical protein